MAVMTNTEFINKLLNVLNYKTLYVYGCFGAPLRTTSAWDNKYRYTHNQDYNKESKRYAMIMAASDDTFGFDCVCLLKGVLWGWSGDNTLRYGGASYSSNGVPDATIRSMINSYSTGKSNVFDISSMVPGEIVTTGDYGHIGVYIGNGLAIECTPKWENRVQVTACNCTKAGYNRRDWTYHGLLTKFIDYVGYQAPAGVSNAPSASVAGYSIGAYNQQLAVKTSANMAAAGNRDSSVNTNTRTQLAVATEQAQVSIETIYVNTNRASASNKYATSFKVDSLRGIEGIPYQFLPSVDRRLKTDRNSSANDIIYSNNEEITDIGRKYTEKIVTQIPLLFLMPCDPMFMSDPSFSDPDRNIMVNAMLGTFTNSFGEKDIDNVISGHGRFYSAKANYAGYYAYLNVMLRAVALFLGIGDVKVKLGNGTECALKDVNWIDDINQDFEGTYLSQQNLIFYMDSIDTINESFGNSSRQSTVASMINGFSDTAKEIDFLFGSGNAISSIADNVADSAASITEAVTDLLPGLGGGIVKSLGNGGIESILNGGKIIFPEMWEDSAYDKSYSISLKLRSPDNDSLSIFMNVLKPYCKILALTLPHTIGDNINTYRTPFITKAYCKGLFNIDLGIISALSASKGATCCWNDDGLPTQIDLDIEIKDLYSQLAMTGLLDDAKSKSMGVRSIVGGMTGEVKQIYNITSNTAYIDFLANMAGLNVAMSEWGRKYKMYLDLASGELSNLNIFRENIGNRFTDAVTNTIARFYAR